MSYDCVVDASVAIKLFLVEPLSDRVDRLFDHLADAPAARFYVPDLFFIECTNILYKYVLRFGYPQENAGKDLDDLLHLPFHVASTAELAQSALEIAVQSHASAYDAAYVVLSDQLSLPLVTADEALVQRFQRTRFDVRSLAVWP